MNIEAFIMAGNKRYSKYLKLLAVKDYLSGLGSQNDICIKYEISSKNISKDVWINIEFFEIINDLAWQFYKELYYKISKNNLKVVKLI